jgi:hypothetical protein
VEVDAFSCPPLEVCSTEHIWPQFSSAASIDYSCLHSESWLLNTDSDTSSYFSGTSTDIMPPVSRRMSARRPPSKSQSMIMFLLLMTLPLSIRDHRLHRTLFLVPQLRWQGILINSEPILATTLNHAAKDIGLQVLLVQLLLHQPILGI